MDPKDVKVHVNAKQTNVHFGFEECSFWHRVRMGIGMFWFCVRHKGFTMNKVDLVVESVGIVMEQNESLDSRPTAE